MSVTMTPCLNPKLCGVQNHREGTYPKCQSSRSSSQEVASSSRSSIMSPPSSQSASPPPVVIPEGLDASELAKELKTRDYAELLHSTMSNGTEKYFVVNIEGNGSVFKSTDFPLHGKIVTRDGVEAYAWTGSKSKTRLRDGSIYKGGIWPSDDEGNTDLGSKLSRKDMKALEAIHEEGSAISYLENTPYVEGMTRDEEIDMLAGIIVESQRRAQH